MLVASGQPLGWTGLIRVDGETYTWMGMPKGIDFGVADQIAYEYTSTKSVFTMSVDDMVVMKITFLSPLTPNDLKRQSLIFSYMEVEVWAIDGLPHNVQLYTDISAGKPSYVLPRTSSL
jgi:hypothetical protein